MTQAQEYRPPTVLVDMAYESLAYWVGDDATRQQAEQALSLSKFHVGMSDEIRAAVLERFEPERDPVEGKDYFRPWGAC